MPTVGNVGGFPGNARLSGGFVPGGIYQGPYGQTGFADVSAVATGPQRITPPPAPPISTLTEDFTTQDTSKWTGWTAGNVVSGGQLQIATTNAYAGITSAQLYALRDSILTVEIVQLPNLGTGTTSMYLQAVVDPNNAVQISWEGGNLRGTTLIAGVRSDVAIPYNATAHRIWRLRESGGTLYFEASSSGAAWTNIRPPMVTPLDLTAVSVTLNSGYYGTESSPGSAIYDNLNAAYADPPPGPRTLYVDPAGSDSNNGLTTGTAWATVSKVTNTVLYPGDVVYFKRGGTWTGNLAMTSSGTATLPITVTNYGAGALPIITGGGSSGVAGSVKPCEIFGSFITIDGLEIRGSSTINVDVVGADCAVQNCTLRWGTVGVHQQSQAARLDILNNTFTDVNVGIIGPGSNDDTGANAVVLDGDSAEVAFNTATNCYFVSPDYGYDGSFCDIYGATNAVIHHNVASQTIAFGELGNPASANNTFYNNTFASSLPTANGFVVHGTTYDDGVSTDIFGPVLGTKIYHNTVYLTNGDPASIGIWMDIDGELDFQNNIIVVTGSAVMAAIRASNRVITEAGNVYWNISLGAAGTLQVKGAATPDATSTIADPQLINAPTDLRVLAGSPALDRGQDVGLPTDLAGNPRIAGAAPDAGAYEGAVSIAGAALPVTAAPTADAARATATAAVTLATSAGSTATAGRVVNADASLSASVSSTAATSRAATGGASLTPALAGTAAAARAAATAAAVTATVTPATQGGVTRSTDAALTAATAAAATGARAVPAGTDLAGVGTAVTAPIPAYFNPTLLPQQWDELAAYHGAGVPFIVISPASGPGTVVDPAYAARIAQVQAYGVKVLGYVNTQYGTIAAATVDADIDGWRSLYPSVDGIFFDLTDGTSSTVTYYQARAAKVRSTGTSTQRMVATNPGWWPTDEAHIALSDCVMVFENNYSTLLSTPEAWYPGYTLSGTYPADRFWWAFYDVPNLAAAAEVLRRAHAWGIGRVYVTDDPTPYDALPTYWRQLLLLSAGAGSTAVGLPAAGASTAAATTAGATIQSGDATLAETATGTAAGARVAAGGAAQALAVGGTASASVTRAGDATQALTEAGIATAAAVRGADSAQAETATGAATVTATRSSDAALPATATATATGSRIAAGDAAQALTAAATAVASATRTGDSTQATTAGSSSAGAVTRIGDGTQATTAGSATSTTSTRAGTASLTETATGAADGARPTSIDAALTATASSTADGAVLHGNTGDATLAVAAGSSATASVARAGAAAATETAGTAATGARTSTGDAAASVAESTSSSASRSVTVDAGLVANNISGSSVTRSATGDTALSVAESTSASSSATRGGDATSTLTVTGTAGAQPVGSSSAALAVAAGSVAAATVVRSSTSTQTLTAAPTAAAGRDVPTTASPVTLTGSTSSSAARDSAVTAAAAETFTFTSTGARAAAADAVILGALTSTAGSSRTLTGSGLLALLALIDADSALGIIGRMFTLTVGEGAGSLAPGVGPSTLTVEVR